jgi:hypothetical protein
MFDFIGDYIGWLTDDGVTFGSVILLGLSAVAVIVVVLLAMAAVVALIGAISPPYGQARAEAKAEWERERQHRA